MSIDNIKYLAGQVIGPKSDFNKINELLQLCASDAEAVREAAIPVMRKVFKVLIAEKQIIKFKHNSSTELLTNNKLQKIQQFLLTKFLAFVSILTKYICIVEMAETLKGLSLRIMIELSRYVQENCQMAGEYLENFLYREVMHHILKISHEPSFCFLMETLKEYAENFSDFNLSSLKFLREQLQTFDLQEKHTQIKNIISYLKFVPDLCRAGETRSFISKLPQSVAQAEEQGAKTKKRKYPFLDPQEEDMTESLKQTDKKKLAKLKEKSQDKRAEKDAKLKMEQNPAKLEFTTLIFDLLKLIRSEEGLVQNFLGIANRHVIPQLENPLLLANFFTDAFDNTRNIDVQIMSLGCLLVLIGNHQLEYPNFYQKLYLLLSRSSDSASILLASQSQRFLKILETVLKSSKLSLGLISSFLKKLLQASMTHPPNVILWVCALMVNLMKKNTSLMKMIDMREVKERVTDPFQKQEENVNHTNASKSYLWEIKSLQNHYLPDVNKIIDSLGQNLDMVNFFDLEHFLNLSYQHFIDLNIEKCKEKAEGDIGLNPKVLQYDQAKMLNSDLFK